jgi:hypothetical protein
VGFELVKHNGKILAGLVRIETFVAVVKASGTNGMSGSQRFWMEPLRWEVPPSVDWMTRI